MAQLSNDCFAFGGGLLQLDVAISDLSRRLAPVTGREWIAVVDATSRVLAETATAGFAIPGFANSAVDGFAVRFADLSLGQETRMPVVARVPAGLREVAAIQAGHAVRIFTGALMPSGADTVFMQEDVRIEGDYVHLPAGLKRGSNARLAGEDFAAGAEIVAAGTRLQPQHVAGLAAAGLARVQVHKRLKVGVFSTGNEIIESGSTSALQPGCQFDANRPMLRALLGMRGMEVVDLGIMPDNEAVIARSLAAAAEHCDAILTSGGVSTGEEDHVKAALESAGRLDFWRLAIKPGRPVAMGMINGKAFLGMPGNPAAVFVTFTRFVGPVLDMLAGTKPADVPAFAVPSGFTYRKKADRREYVRATLGRDENGAMTAQRFERDGAALISSLIAAEGLVELEEERLGVEEGELIRFLPLTALLL